MLLNTRDSDNFVDTELSKEIQYLVEVDSYSKHKLFVEHKLTQVTSGGSMIHVGMFGDMPICMTLSVVKVNEKYVMMYEPTSMVVHYRMVEDWLKSKFPHLFEGRYRLTDANNFHNVMLYCND